MDHITIRLYAAGIGIVVGEFLGSFDDLALRARRFCSDRLRHRSSACDCGKETVQCDRVQGNLQESLHLHSCRRGECVRCSHHWKRMRPALCRDLLLHLE